MSEPEPAFNARDLLNRMLLNDGVHPAQAAIVSENAGNNVFASQEVSNYLNTAWNLTPSTLPTSTRNYYANLILIAMRGNPGPLSRAVQRNGQTQPWLNTLVIPKSEPDSVTLAWAQHYMHSRDVASHTGDDLGEGVAIRVYNSGRGSGFIGGGAHASPPSDTAVRWALLGASDGARDFHSEDPAGLTFPGRAFGEYANSIAAEAGARAETAVVGALMDMIPDLVKAFTNLPIGSASTSCGMSAAAGSPDLSVSGTVLPASSAGAQ